MNVHSGCRMTPSMFFRSRKLTPVFPPMAASTWARRVVGMKAKRIPRLKIEAAKPAISVVMPPPTASSRVFRSAPASIIAVQICSTVSSRLEVSEMSKDKRHRMFASISSCNRRSVSSSTARSQTTKTSPSRSAATSATCRPVRMRLMVLPWDMTGISFISNAVRPAFSGAIA